MGLFYRMAAVGFYRGQRGAVLHTEHQYTLLYNVYQRREALVTAHGC